MPFTHFQTITFKSDPADCVSLCQSGLLRCYRCTQHVCVFGANRAIKLDVCEEPMPHSPMTPPLILQIAAKVYCSLLSAYILFAFQIQLHPKSPMANPRPQTQWAHQSAHSLPNTLGHSLLASPLICIEMSQFSFVLMCFFWHIKFKMVKRCAGGTCNSDTRYPERLGDGVYFLPFTKPHLNRDKCLLWIAIAPVNECWLILRVSGQGVV